MLSSSKSFFKGLNLTKTRITFLIITGAVVILTSCGSNAGEELNVAPEEEAHHDEEGNSVEINAAQFRQLDIQLCSVEEKNLESKSIPIHASIVGDKTGLIEGMSVIANINTGTNAVPAVPSSAIASYGGNDYIFIQVKEEDHEHSEEAGRDVHKEADEHNHKDGDLAMDQNLGNEHNHSQSEKVLTPTTTSDNFHFNECR